MNNQYNSTHSSTTILSRVVLCATLFALIISPLEQAAAEWNPATESPYSFGPEGRPIADMAEFGKPREMTGFLPNRPIAARDKYGNRIYYTADGKMSTKISTNGSITVSIKGKTINKDAEGKIISTSEVIKGTNRAEVRNDKGQITGYQELGLGDKVMQEYDADGNLTKTYVYDKYGKNTQWILDELSLSKTIFDTKGEAQYDQNFEGAVVARYYYDNEHRLEYKQDLYDNKSYFDDKGNLTYTEDYKAQKLAQYDYKTDDEGRYILEKMEDKTPGLTSGDMTYFVNGKAQYTKSHFGGVTREYHYDGQTLAYIYDTRTNEVTWYDLNGKARYTTFNEYATKEWLYYQARLVGYYDHSQNAVVLYQFERQDEAAKVIASKDVPTATEIEQYYEQNTAMTAIGKVDLNIDDKRKTTRKDNILQKQDSRSMQKLVDLNIIKDEKSTLTSDKDLLVKSQYNYAKDGKLQSIVTPTPSDGNGWTTQIFFGPGTSDTDRTYMTVTANQSNNTLAAEQLWNALVTGGQSIADIASSGGQLAAFAKSVKSFTTNAATLSKLNDNQLCNLFGWDIDGTMYGVSTKVLIADVRVRMANAGNDGKAQVNFGFESHAETVIATTADNFRVAGTYPGSALDLTTLSNNVSPITTGPAPFSTSATLVKTVNGVTRTYAPNGNIISEIDNNTGTAIYYDQSGRRETAYENGQIIASYFYGSDGNLQTIRSWNSTSGYSTTFFVGWGVAMNGQTQITVSGDQVNNTTLAQQLWNAIESGQNIANISSGREPAVSQELATFALSAQSIVTRPDVIAKMSDEQLLNMLGWDASGTDTTKYLAEVRAWKPGIEGTITITYGLPSSQKHVYATRVESINVEKTEVPFIDTSSESDHDKVVAAIYAIGTVAHVTNAATNAASDATGLSLLNDLSAATASWTAQQ